jgi:hypothetical protein
MVKHAFARRYLRPAVDAAALVNSPAGAIVTGRGTGARLLADGGGDAGAEGVQELSCPLLDVLRQQPLARGVGDDGLRSVYRGGGEHGAGQRVRVVRVDYDRAVELGGGELAEHDLAGVVRAGGREFLRREGRAGRQRSDEHDVGGEVERDSFGEVHVLVRVVDHRVTNAGTFTAAD